MLVCSARLYMKKASWGFCVSVFDSSVGPAVLRGYDDSVFPGGSGTELEVGRTALFGEGADVTMTSLINPESMMGHFASALGDIWVD